MSKYKELREMLNDDYDNFIDALNGFSKEDIEGIRKEEKKDGKNEISFLIACYVGDQDYVKETISLNNVRSENYFGLQIASKNNQIGVMEGIKEFVEDNSEDKKEWFKMVREDRYLAFRWAGEQSQEWLKEKYPNSYKNALEKNIIKENKNNSQWKLEINQLDVGQGDSALFGFINESKPDESIFFMIDGGRIYAKEETKKQFSNFILETKKSYKDIPEKLHVVFKGSKDADHSGGLPIVNKDKELVTKDDTKFFSYKEEGDYKICTVGEDIWKLLGKEKPKNSPNLEIIASGGKLKGGEKVNNPDDNDQSLGFLISYGKFRFFTAGDLGKEAEDNIEFNGEKLSILKISHHGSSHSTSEDFLKEVKPRSTLISHGANKKYNHPAPETLDNIEVSSARFNYMTNPADYTRGQDYLEKYPKTVVAGNGDYILQGSERTTVCKKNYGIVSSDKDPKGHIKIIVDSKQAQSGEYSVLYNRKPPVVEFEGVESKPVTKSKDKRIRNVRDNYKNYKFEEKETNLIKLKKNQELDYNKEYEIEDNTDYISDFEDKELDKKRRDGNLKVTVKIKKDTQGEVDRISVRFYEKEDKQEKKEGNPSNSIKPLSEEQLKLIAKKRYFKDKNDTTISRNQTNYRGG